MSGKNPSPLLPETRQSPTGLPRPLWIAGATMLTICLVVIAAVQRHHVESQRVGVFSYENYQRIQIGMTREQVESLLGVPGEEIGESELPEVVDWTQPVDSQRRLKRVVSGQEFFRWRDDSRKIFVGLQDGSVLEKWHWEPSL